MFKNEVKTIFCLGFGIERPFSCLQLKTDEELFLEINFLKVRICKRVYSTKMR